MQNPEFIIYCGPMFGSKTTKMLAKLERYKYQKRSIVAFKPKIDNRYTESEICTHSGAKIKAKLIESGQDLAKICNLEQYDVIAVDEAFMIPGIGETLINLFKIGKTIIVSSLELSASGNIFDEVQTMFPWATKIEKCAAVCTVCGADAYYTHRKVDNLEEITVGGAELYEPRCWQHHSCFENTEKSCVDHIALRVSDLKEAEEWYTRQLNGKVTFRDPKYIRMRLSNTNIALIDEKHYPHQHFGVLVEKKENLDRHEGIRVEHRDGTTGVYVKDPFGNYLEYIWYSDNQKEVFLDT